MHLKFRAAASLILRQFVRFAWTTTQQKWTTAGVGVALAITTAFIPNLGIAIFGTAFAGWWLVLAVMAVIGGLAGNRVGVGREKATPMSRTPADIQRD